MRYWIKLLKFSIKIHLPGLGVFRKKPISSGTPGKKWKKPISSGFVRTKLEETGQNWKKLWKMSEMLEKKQLSYLISYKRLWLRMHLVNWYCLKTWCRKKTITFGLFFSSFIRTKLEETGSQLGNFNKMSEMLEKLISNHHTYFVTKGYGY